MFSQSFKAAQVIAFVFITFTASAQPYNQPADDHSNQLTTFEPARPAHMQLDILQKETGKLSVTIVNPFTKSATILVCKGRDILYALDGVKGQYKTLFNFNELEDGDYKIVVISGKESVTKDVNIHTSTTTERDVVVN